jgi:organic radical activating enzyme
VVITGGEPFRQNIEPLVRILTGYGYTVQIETNGTMPPPSDSFWTLVSLDTNKEGRCFIVCSPKTPNIHPRTRDLVCAYKYVMSSDSVAEDGLPLLALDHSADPFVCRPHFNFRGQTYLQPLDAKSDQQNAANLDACVRSCLLHGYTLQLQIHKLINLE